MNGGDSTTFAGGRSRNGDQVVRGDELAQVVEACLRHLQQLRRCGMVRRDQRQRLLRGLARRELRRGLVERVRVAREVGLGNRQQPIERGVHHLVGAVFLLERVSADRVGPFRPRLQVLLQERLVLRERVDDRLVGRLEIRQQRRVLDVGERRRHDLREKADVAVHLLDRDVGVDRRRVVQVLPALLQGFQHQPLARDERLQPHLRRREAALDHDVGRARDAAAVDVRVLGPRANHLVLEQVRVDGRDDLREIELVGQRQVRGIDGAQTAPGTACSRQPPCRPRRAKRPPAGRRSRGRRDRWPRPGSASGSRRRTRRTVSGSRRRRSPRPARGRFGARAAGNGKSEQKERAESG